MVFSPKGKYSEKQEDKTCLAQHVIPNSNVNGGWREGGRHGMGMGTLEVEAGMAAGGGEGLLPILHIKRKQKCHLYIY